MDYSCSGKENEITRVGELTNLDKIDKQVTAKSGVNGIIPRLKSFGWMKIFYDSKSATVDVMVSRTMRKDRKLWWWSIRVTLKRKSLTISVWRPFSCRAYDSMGDKSVRYDISKCTLKITKNPSMDTRRHLDFWICQKWIERLLQLMFSVNFFISRCSMTLLEDLTISQ